MSERIYGKDEKLKMAGKFLLQVSVEEKLVGAVDALTTGRAVVTLFQNEDIFVERLGFCLTDMGTLGKESAAPILCRH